MFDLAAELKDVRTVAIGGHVRPDGDCVGACLGLAQYLREYYPEISTDVYLGDFSDSFLFLKGADQVLRSCEKEISYDLFFALDCGDEDRLGDAVRYFQTAAKTICIDHHISNRSFADANMIDPDASSASELICRLLDQEKITKEIAEALYMGIAHDTGVFQYSCTSGETMRLAAMLMEKGIDFSRIIDRTFYQKTYVQNQILGRALLESMMILDKKIIFSAVRQKDMKFYGVTPKDLDGIVAQLRNTKGVEAAIFLYEVSPQEFKVSMRSNGVINVSEIASYFGGGGHVKAAGCTMQGSFYDVVNNLVAHMDKQLKQVKS